MAAPDFAKYGLKKVVDPSKYGLRPVTSGQPTSDTQNTNEAPQPEGFGQHLLNTSKEANQAIMDYGVNPIDKYLIDSPRSAGLGFIQGLANIPSGAANAGIWAANKMGAHLNNVPEFDFAPHNLPAMEGNIGSFFYGPGGVMKAAGEIPHLAAFGRSALSLPMIAHGIGQASNILSKYPMASNIAGNALKGAAYSPTNPLLGMAMGAGGAAIAPAIGNVLSKAYNALRPSVYLRGNLSPEELQRNLEDAKGTETGLGHIIGSPSLMRIQENYLSKIPFTGAVNAMQRSAGQVIERGHNILNQLLGKNNPEGFETSLNQALKDVYKEHHELKTSLYDEANAIADKEGLDLPLPKFANKANLYRQALENTNILQYEPEMASLINKLKNYQNPLNEATSSYPTLKEANLLKAKLNQLVEQYSESPLMTDRHAASVFRDLHSELKDDILTGIKASGNKDLLAAYKAAESNYAKNFSPFLDKDVYKFINSNSTDPDLLLQTFIKTGKSTDRANLLKKLSEKLPPDKQNLLGYAYLQRALDENNVLNPRKLNTLISRNALGPRQFEALFPDKEIRNQLNSYRSLVNKNSHGLGLMENPKTGAMMTDVIPLLTGGPSSLGATIGGRKFNSLLTNEETRNNLVQQMIANGQKP
jgi:hypothetical protein